MSELAIETTGLRRRFGSFEALKGIDLRVPLGSTFGLVGPNGSGKTTTFSILCGFLKPTEGTVRLLGHDASDRAALLGRVGALPQDAPLPPRMTAPRQMSASYSPVSASALETSGISKLPGHQATSTDSSDTP